MSLAWAERLQGSPRRIAAYRVTDAGVWRKCACRCATSAGSSASEHQRLPETARAVAREIAAEIPPPGGACRAIARKVPRLAPRAPDAADAVVQVLGQVVHRRPDFRMQRVRRAIGGMAQRKQVERQAAPFEREQLLRDERLRQAWIALENDRDRTAGTGCGCRRRSHWRCHVGRTLAEMRIGKCYHRRAPIRTRPRASEGSVTGRPFPAWTGHSFATFSGTPGGTRRSCSS